MLLPISPVILSKRTLDFAFRDMDLPLLTWKDQEPVRPVARALFSADAGEDIVTAPSATVISKPRRPRKTLAPTPIVDTSDRRCTRSAVQRDWFNPDVYYTTFFL